MTLQYLGAHNKKLSNKETLVKQDVKNSKFARSGGRRDIMRCCACDGRGRKAVDYPNIALTSWNELTSCFHQSYYYKCGLTRHGSKGCKNSLLRTQSTQRRPKGQSTDRILTQSWPFASAMQVSRRTKDKDTEAGMETLKLKTGE